MAKGFLPLKLHPQQNCLLLPQSVSFKPSKPPKQDAKFAQKLAAKMVNSQVSATGTIPIEPQGPKREINPSPPPPNST
ncbi:hypothetical protein BDA96_02G284600 [Sorghum bicolor]|uniref:Uncharacterized protein n=2 Tax=Sorghum bicolor TaxID=4558 RepID=A0A921UUD8_SORBI|nr:hypothetical protein BDA96_02G284600 [Sorghum bicolor]OQU89798.1 hypothetical protein SORBI_3002G270733 [Sorghum bicolor]